MLAATRHTMSALKHWDIVGHVQHGRGGLGEEQTFLDAKGTVQEVRR